MKVLALDSATAACSAAIWIDGALAAHEMLAMTRGHAEALLPLVERVRAAAGINFAALDRLAVTRGPGHFTGLRAGLAAARGLALALGKPLLGVTTLEAIAAPAQAAGCVIVAILDSKRATPYLQAFAADLRPLTPPAAQSVGDFAAALAQAQAGASFVVVGDRAADMIAALTACGAAATAAAAPPLPDAAVVARLAAAAPLPDAPPAPLYLHPPETTAPRRAVRPASGDKRADAP